MPDFKPYPCLFLPRLWGIFRDEWYQSNKQALIAAVKLWVSNEACIR